MPAGATSGTSYTNTLQGNGFPVEFGSAGNPHGMVVTAVQKTINYEYEYLGIPFDNAVTAPKIETGSYVGTGTYGASNPNTLTFGFAPKLVLIYNGSKDYAMFFAFGLEGGYTPGGYLFAWSSEMAVSNDTYAKINGNVLNWYASNTSATTSRSIQFNVESQTYHYLAIG